MGKILSQYIYMLNHNICFICLLTEHVNYTSWETWIKPQLYKIKVGKTECLPHRTFVRITLNEIRHSINGTVYIPHELPQIASTLTDLQLPDHGKDVNQNPPEKGLQTPEFPACCHGCWSITTAASFNFLFANQGSVWHESGHSYIYRCTTSDGPLCSCELGIKADLHNV